MPKLRNSATDVGCFTQWIGRKIRNHNPLEELKMADRNKRPNIYKSKNDGPVFTYAGIENELIATAGARTFKVTVEEIDGTAVDEDQLVKVA